MAERSQGEHVRNDNPRTENSRSENRREFGRDGISGILTTDRALRAREVSKPAQGDQLDAERVLDALLARVEGRRR